jgi:hypothetical protein
MKTRFLGDVQAIRIRELQDRIKRLEEENDAMRADLLLWNEKDAK